MTEDTKTRCLPAISDAETVSDRVSASGVREAANSILENGFAITTVDNATAFRISQVFVESHRFFNGSKREKLAFSWPDILEGYRELGAEYSQNPGRPDLNESYSVVKANQAIMRAMRWSEKNAMFGSMSSLLESYFYLANSIFEMLRLQLNSEGDELICAGLTYLQVNYYHPGLEKRLFLQDAHEDGHLVTIASSFEPGLEIKVDGVFRPVEVARNQVLIMPGSLLTIMTGGKVSPLIHRVRNVKGVKDRASLMFFVNPDLDHPPSPWLLNENGEAPDLAKATIEASRAFGLPSIELAGG